MQDKSLDEMISAMNMSTKKTFRGISPRNPKNHPLKIFERAKAEGVPVLVAGPMVRYSKLPFRRTVRTLNPNVLVYSPMILAREFVRADFARKSDFTTDEEDAPLIIQFGTNNELDITRAALMVRPFCDGISINCGCPVKEQVREGIGAALMSDPYKVAGLVRSVKEACGSSFCVETKIRIHTDIQETLRFAEILEEAGVDYITVHARRQADRSSVSANLEAVRKIKAHVKCPVVANGDCFKPCDVQRIMDATNADGVMAARGILTNPALFAGYETTPWKVVELMWHHMISCGLPFQLILHQMSELTTAEFSKLERISLNSCTTTVQLINWFDKHFDLKRFGEPGFAERDEWPWKVDRS